VCTSSESAGIKNRPIIDMENWTADCGDEGRDTRGVRGR